MGKSYDEKRADFQRMLEGRLPKAVKAVELLGNLARKSDYAWTNTELQSMVDALDDAVDSVMTAFGIDAGSAAPAPEEASPAAPAAGGADLDGPAPVDPGESRSSYRNSAVMGSPLTNGVAGAQDLPSIGGQPVRPDQRCEVRWAYDAVRRGDKKLAEDRLYRVLEDWIKEEFM